MDNLISLCQCQSVITFLTFFFYQLYEMFCKYAKEYPDLGMTPAEFAEFLSREQEVSNGELLHLTSVLVNTQIISYQECWWYYLICYTCCWWWSCQ